VISIEPEIYLQLNLFEDASTLARRAHVTFEGLGNSHEAAMAQMFLGISEFKLLHDTDAEKAFLTATATFQKAGNETWGAAVDLWRAQLFLRQRRFAVAHDLANHSAEVFDRRRCPYALQTPAFFRPKACRR
jgi:hypothetical protein